MSIPEEPQAEGGNGKGDEYHGDGDTGFESGLLGDGEGRMS